MVSMTPAFSLSHSRSVALRSSKAICIFSSSNVIMAFCGQKMETFLRKKEKVRGKSRIMYQRQSAHATYWPLLASKSMRGKCLIHDVIIQQACHSCNTGNTNKGFVEILRPQCDAAELCQDIWTVAVLKTKSRNKHFTHQKTDKTGSKAHQGTVVPEQQNKNKQRLKQVKWN